MRTVSGTSLVVWQKTDRSSQGTVDFMSIEVAVQNYLFQYESDVEQSCDESIQIAKDLLETGFAKFAFAHNHLHELESLWWVVVWIVFYNDFCAPQQLGEEEHLSDRKLQLQQQLRQARILFPSSSTDTGRRDGFLFHFRDIVMELPESKHIICSGLKVLRRDLIGGYRLIEATLPHSIDMSAFTDIYDTFGKAIISFQESEFVLWFNP